MLRLIVMPRAEKAQEMQNKIDIARAMSTTDITLAELEAEQKQGAKVIASFENEFAFLNEKLFICFNLL